MILLNDIFEIISSQREGDQYTFNIRLLHECPIYKGHFPGNPITPGVVIMGIARELIEHQSGVKLELTEVASVKYTSILSPIKNGNVSYDICCRESENNVIKAKISVHDSDQTFARMSLTWARAN